MPGEPAMRRGGLLRLLRRGAFLVPGLLTRHQLVLVGEARPFQSMRRPQQARCLRMSVELRMNGERKMGEVQQVVSFE